jgi:broad specificity phosphatase PhoE
MLRVILLRHGETEYNAEGNRYCGRTDIGLTEIGINQAWQVLAGLQGVTIDVIYSSPLERARHTAEIAGGGMPVVTDNRLLEINFGTWEGKTRAEFITENSALWHSWITNPEQTKAGGTGETGREILDRVDDFYLEMLSKHDSQTIMVVGHNGINRLYMAYKLGMPSANYGKISQENSSITVFELDKYGDFLLKKLNASKV